MYHINSNQKVGRCSADPGRCPFGGESEHFDTALSAEAEVERRKTLEATQDGKVASTRKRQKEAQELQEAQGTIPLKDEEMMSVTIPLDREEETKMATCEWCGNQNDQDDYSEYCTQCDPYINDCESDGCRGVYFDGEGYDLILPDGECRTLCEYCYDNNACSQCGDNYATMDGLCSGCAGR